MINVSRQEMGIIRQILARHVPEREVRVFGSRATSKAKKYSDLDLVVMGPRKLTGKVLRALRDDFAESELTYRVDIIDWNSTSESFCSIINKGYEVIQKPKVMNKEEINNTKKGE